MTTILYVEDHPPAQMLMRAIFSDLLSYQLIMAKTGEEALEQTGTHHPDLYIIDLDLPDTDGLTLARALRQMHLAPVVLVSAYAEAIKLEQVSDIVQDYLAKPLDPNHVAQTIQRTLARLA
jgi:two-component system KDP operon response regulator KdpE